MIIAALMSFGGIAFATPTKVFTSDYSMKYKIYGDTTFGIKTDRKVHVRIDQVSGPSEAYQIRIERQTCGAFGCHWKGEFVGTQCSRTISTTTPKECNFVAAENSSELHRIVMWKPDDGKYVSGTVKVD